MTAPVAASFAPVPETVGKAMEELQRRGFTVTGQGILTLFNKGLKSQL